MWRHHPVPEVVMAGLEKLSLARVPLSDLDQWLTQIGVIQRTRRRRSLDGLCLGRTSGPCDDRRSHSSLASSSVPLARRLHCSSMQSSVADPDAAASDANASSFS